MKRFNKGDVVVRGVVRVGKPFVGLLINKDGGVVNTEAAADLIGRIIQEDFTPRES